MVIQREHAQPSAGLDVRGDAEGLVVADQRLDRGRGDHHFKRRHPAGTVHAGQQQLGDDRVDRGGQLGPDLLLLVGREGVHDAVHRTGGARGVQRGEHEVAGFRRGDRRFHRFQVAHFADENDVRVLAEGAPEGLAERGDIHADFALGDDGFLVAVVILDRVFDRDDVAIARLVDDVDHAREGRGFSGTGGSRDQHEAAGGVQDVLDLRRQPDFIQRQHARGNQAQHHAVIPLLAEHAHAEPGALAERKTEVAPAVLLHFLDVFFRCDGPHQPLGVVLGQPFAIQRLE